MIKIHAIERHGIEDIEQITQQPQLNSLMSEKQSCQIKTDRIRVPAIGIRANELREAIATGSSIRFRTPRTVERFIARKQLFSTHTQ